MITLKNPNVSDVILLPTRISDIKQNDLELLTTNIKLPKYYCIIALCFKTKLFDLAFITGKSKNSLLKVTPIMCKISEEDSKERNINICDRVIIDRSSIERGVHINIPTAVSSNAVINYIDSDQEFKKKLTTDAEYAKLRSQQVIVMEFKIVPINDIYGAVDLKKSYHDPYSYLADDVVDDAN